MENPEEYTPEWFKKIVAAARECEEVNPALTLHMLLNDLENYIDFLERRNMN